MPETTTEAPAFLRDPSDIDPDKHAKYSPYLHKFLTKRNHSDRRGYLVYRKPGYFWPYIGNMSGDEFFGYSLADVTTKPDTARGHLGHRDNLELDPDFWQRYVEIGRCAYDPEHTTQFSGEEPGGARPRWKMDEDGEGRTCLWCGARQERQRFSVPKIKWVLANVEPDASADDLGEPRVIGLLPRGATEALLRFAEEEEKASELRAIDACHEWRGDSAHNEAKWNAIDRLFPGLAARFVVTPEEFAEYRAEWDEGAIPFGETIHDRRTYLFDGEGCDHFDDSFSGTLQRYLDVLRTGALRLARGEATS